MPRDVVDIPRLVAGEIVRDRRGNVGYARYLRNRSTGEMFWTVRISEGPDKARTWGRAADFEPVLDLDGGTVPNHCERCGRTFLAHPYRLESGREIAREQFCRACSKVGAQVETARQQADGFIKGCNTSIDFSKVSAPATQPVEKHPAGCLCGLTQDCTPY